ncbi:Bcr/CflA family efflux MFS transporter [Paludibacterium sp. B53371]|uniref:Bcr/CflA family efflux MFS transporter n=1 Tax=Paludibacterium sp. B53371 TaxID=2806263 RepID=UPI001C05904C|nr:Bcr/CflA family efflux MFS transporter [Paludibacterium sp. B53371]
MKSAPPIQWRQLAAIVLIACFAQLAADVYAPALPAIARDFRVSIGQVQLSMAVYMATLSLSQLGYGPLSDMLGRRRVLALGCLIAMAGSLLAALAPSIDALLLARAIQGAGAGACAAIWRAVFRDLFSGEALSRYASYFVVLILFIMPAAPLIGAYLSHLISWRANFVFLLGYALLALAVLHFAFQETQASHHRQALSLSGLWQGYAELLRTRAFLRVALMTFVCYGSYFAWFSMGPVLLTSQYGQSGVFFGWLTGAGGGLCYGLAAWCNGRLVKQRGLTGMLQLALACMLAGALLMLALSWLPLGLGGLVLALMVYWFGAALVWPNTNALAFSSVGHIAGSAAALYGCLQLGGAACVTQLISLLPHDRLWPLQLLMLTAPLLSWLLLRMARPAATAAKP